MSDHADSFEISSLTGRVAVITGAGAGIGKCTARLLAKRGALVVASDLDAMAVEAVVADIVATGGQAIASTTDVSSEDAVIAMVGAAESAYGRLDVLVNCAGLTSAGHMSQDGRITEMSVDVWDRTMEVNLRGTMLAIKHAVPVMIRSGGGSIVNISSNAALRGSFNVTAYGASKAAVLALTYYTAVQFSRERIRCNAVLPDSVGDRPRIMSPDLKAHLDASSLLGREGTPLDVARGIAFLCSPEADWVTGAVLPLNGGMEVANGWWHLSRREFEERAAVGSGDAEVGR